MTGQTRDAACVLEPGVTLCADCRSRDAEVVSDPDDRWARAVCFECVEDFLERDKARSVSVEAADVIVRATGEARYRPLPVVVPKEPDMSKVEELRRQWRRFSATVVDAGRCWAALADGSRCVRAAAEEGVCETHAIKGCTLPGLGWRGGVPQGRMVSRRGKGKR